jgi:hypothetical protein
MEAFRPTWESELTISPIDSSTLYAFAQTKRTVRADIDVIVQELEEPTQESINRPQPMSFSSIGLLA